MNHALSKVLVEIKNQKMAGLLHFLAATILNVELSKISNQQLVSISRRVTDEMGWVEAASGLYVFSFHMQFMGD